MASPVPVFLALFALIGCAGVPPRPDPVSSFVFRSRHVMVMARLDRDGLSGTSVNVAHEGADYRGGAGGRVVHLSTRDGHVSGMIGIETSDFVVEDHPGVLLVRGRLGGDGTTLAISDGGVVGRIGLCVYDLRRAALPDPWYTGIATDDEHTPLQLRLPPALLGRPPVERGVFVTLFLMSLCGRLDTLYLGPIAGW